MMCWPESFPASDPPAWTPGMARPAPEPYNDRYGEAPLTSRRHAEPPRLCTSLNCSISGLIKALFACTSNESSS